MSNNIPTGVALRPGGGDDGRNTGWCDGRRMTAAYGNWQDWPKEKGTVRQAIREKQQPKKTGPTFCLKNLIDLNRIVLCVAVALYHEDGKTRAKPGDYEDVFTNNTLQHLFSHAEIYLNEKLISHSNNYYLHSAFVETELSTDTESKNTWADYQGYNYCPS